MDQALTNSNNSLSGDDSAVAHQADLQAVQSGPQPPFQGELSAMSSADPLAKPGDPSATAHADQAYSPSGPQTIKPSPTVSDATTNTTTTTTIAPAIVVTNNTTTIPVLHLPDSPPPPIPTNSFQPIEADAFYDSSSGMPPKDSIVPIPNSFSEDDLTALQPQQQQQTSFNQELDAYPQQQSDAYPQQQQPNYDQGSDAYYQQQPNVNPGPGQYPQHYEQQQFQSDPALAPPQPQTARSFHSPANSVSSISNDLGRARLNDNGYDQQYQQQHPPTLSYNQDANNSSSSVPQIIAPVAQAALPHPSFKKHLPPFGSSSSRASSPASRLYDAPGSANSLSNLAPPAPGFSLSHADASGQSIVRSASTPNVMNQGLGSVPNSPRLSPMLQPQRNSSANFLSTNRHSARPGTPSRPFSSMSSASSVDVGSGSGSHHATDFYSYTNNSGGRSGGGHGRTQSMAFTELAGTSAFDLSQTFLSANLGPNSSSLVPRMKTIEMYRKNAKKSNDPVIQFQFAQYMLQTALLASTASASANMAKSPLFSGLDDDEDFDLEFAPLPNHNGTRHTSQLSNASILSLGNTGNSNNAASASEAGGSPMLEPYSAKDEYRIKRGLLKESISLLRKLADRGYADAQYLLGDAYSSGALGKSDLKESFALFQLAAKHGHAEASYRTALCLEEGWGTSKDPRKALQFLRQAASRNHPGAMLRLGVACFYGKLGLHIGASTANRVKIQQEGIKWLTRAADVANEIFPQGPYELAKIYEDGYRDLVFKDLQYSVQLYVKSADLNYVPAASKLGHAYEYGELGCPQDAALSIHYYTIGAMGGDATAMLAMCAWYMVGAEPMLPRNEEEAYEWALRAAERGLPKAQYATGYFVENGIGTERDILQASKWYHLAADGGDERAIERIKNNRILAAKPNTKHRKKSIGNLKSLVGGSSSSTNTHDRTQSIASVPASSRSVQTQQPPPPQQPELQPPQQQPQEEQNQDQQLLHDTQSLQQPPNLPHNAYDPEARSFAGSVAESARIEGISVNNSAIEVPPAKSKKNKDKDCVIM